MNNNKDKKLIYIAAFLRSISIGMIAVLLAIYLMKVGLTKTEIGLVISCGLMGASAGTLFTTFFGDIIGRKNLLILYCLFSAIAAVFVGIFTSFYIILITAFFGMINARGKDRGPALVVETAILPSLENNQNRTKAFAWYYIYQDIGLAIGGLAAGLPTLLSNYLQIPVILSFQIAFGLYAIVMFASACCYYFLSESTELTPKESKFSFKKMNFKFSDAGKKMAMKWSVCFALDGLAGGFLTKSLLAFYFYERFDVGIEKLGLLFFTIHCLNGISHLGSAWIAKRAGLVNTMVFTHTISHAFLLAIAFAPTFPIAVACYILRECWAKMEGPTKRSYMMSVTNEDERTKLSGITQMIRTLGWAIAPAFAGFIMDKWSLASPLIIGVGMKTTYDMLLYFSFRKIKPPEEKQIEEISIQTEPVLKLA